MSKTLTELFPDMVNEDVKKKKEEDVAAQLLKSLTDTQTKDTQIALRINSNAYTQLKRIAARKGLRAQSIITMLINDYLRANQDLLSE